MIEILDDSDGNILGVRATGKLTGGDYRDVLAPRIRALLERFPRLRVLFLIDEPFDGWTVHGAWRYCQILWIGRFQATSVAVVAAAAVDEAAVMSRGRSSSLPLWNSAPARTSATSSGALTLRQRAWAASIGL